MSNSPGLEQTYHAHHFIFSFTLYFILFIPFILSWLPVGFLLHHTIVFI